MRKVYLLGFITLMISSVCFGQYNRSAGLRLGHSSGATFKKFFHEEEAFEIMLTWRQNGLQLTGLYQFHQPLKFKFTDRVYLNYGVGGHFGYKKKGRHQVVRDPYNDQNYLGYRSKTEFVMGVDGIVGLEYRWLSVPMTINLDLKPYFEFTGMQSADLSFWDTAISFKYVF